MLTQHSQFAAFQEFVSEEFPNLQPKYELQGEFTSHSSSVVGQAGIHADGVVHFATPDAAVAYPAALVASASAPFIGPLGFGVGVGIAGASATRHPSGSIVERAEAELGLSVADQAAIDWGPAGGAPELQLYRAGMWSATAYGAGLAYLDRYYTANVARGMSPNGASLDGRPIVIGVFEVRAFPDEQTGRIAEIYIPVDAAGQPIGEPIRKEFAITADGRVAQINERGQTVFIVKGSGIAHTEVQAPDTHAPNGMPLEMITARPHPDNPDQTINSYWSRDGESGSYSKTESTVSGNRELLGRSVTRYEYDSRGRPLGAVARCTTARADCCAPSRCAPTDKAAGFRRRARAPAVRSFRMR